MNADPRPSADPRLSEDATERAPVRRGASILPFAHATGRRFRRVAEMTEPNGAILLFTGVRYERMDHDDARPAGLGHPAG